MKKRILAAVAALVSCAGAAFAAGDWSVTLDGFDSSKKVSVIKAVRTASGLSLMDSKKLVESAPAFVKGDLSEAEADKILADLTAAGGRASKNGPDTPAAATAPSGWSVTLEACGSQKIAVIKVVRTATGLGLADSKKLVESAPTIVKSNMSEADAKKLATDLAAAGATASSNEPAPVEKLTLESGRYTINVKGYPADGDAGINRAVDALRAAGCDELADQLKGRDWSALRSGGGFQIGSGYSRDSAEAVVNLLKGYGLKESSANSGRTSRNRVKKEE